MTQVVSAAEPSATMSPSAWRAAGTMIAWRGHRVFVRDSGGGGKSGGGGSGKSDGGGRSGDGGGRSGDGGGRSSEGGGRSGDGGSRSGDSGGRSGDGGGGSGDGGGRSGDGGGRSGDGGRDRPPLLLLHGFPTSSWDWRHVWDALAARYRVIAYDYVGFGFSDKPARGPYTIMAYADQAEAVLAALAISRVDLLAHDLGDTVAQELLARDRGATAARLASACLLNGGVFPELHRPRLIQTLLNSPLGFLVARLTNRARFARGLGAVFGPHTQPSAAELDGFWECAAYNHGLANYHLLIRYMRERRVHRDRWVTPILTPHIPLAFINGHRDPVSGKHVVEHLRSLSAPVEIHDLPEIGHYPQTEAPADVLAAYFAFRDRLARG